MYIKFWIASGFAFAMTMLSARHCEPLAVKQSGFIEEINKNNKKQNIMKRNYKVFSTIVIVNIIVMLHVLTPAYAGVGLYGKQQSVTSSRQTDETKQDLLSSSSSSGSIGLFDTSSQSTLTVAPGGIGSGNGSHVPVADGLGILLVMAGGYLLRRKS